MYADPGYDPADVKAAPNSHLYPAAMTATTEVLSWDQVTLPKQLPVHGLRLQNRMPQLGVLLEVRSYTKAIILVVKVRR